MFKFFRNFSKRSTSFFSNMFGNIAGITVNEKTSLKLTAVYSCIKCIAETFAILPAHIYRRTDKGKEKAVDHPQYTLIHLRPNYLMTKFNFMLTVMTHVLTNGNAYCELSFDNRGYVTGMFPLDPLRTHPFLDSNNNIKYRHYTDKGSEIIFPRWKIIHIYGLGWTGLLGLSPIQLHKSTLGIGLATDEFGVKFYNNGLNTGYALEHPTSLSDKAYNHIKESFKKKYQGIRHAHDPLILEESMKLVKLGMPLTDIQYIETKKITVEEIARIYRVPPHKIALLDRATFSNIEQQSIDFVNDCITPWVTLFEEIYNWELFSKYEREEYYVKFDINGLLRGTLKERYEAYKIGKINGWLNADEIRGLEDMNHLPDELGQIYLQQLNMIDVAIAKKNQYGLDKDKS